jgi:AcrR family transcriptional regulator
MPSSLSRSHTRRPRATARWRCAPPIQARSRETVDRFALAAEALLRARPFEEIGVQDIVRRAGRPIGSFYARFASKEALLPLLYQRYHDGLETLVAARLARVPWATLDLRRTVDAFVVFVIALYTDRPWLTRALALFARTRPEALPSDLVERRRTVYAPVMAVLLRHRARIAHPDPEAAVRFVVFLALSVAREKLLFAEAPQSRLTPMPRTALRNELARVVLAYLTIEAPR